MRKTILVQVLALMALVGLAGCFGGSSSNMNAKALTIVKRKQIAIPTAELSGVWRDITGSVIVAIHQEGEEVRLVVAAGDTRKYLTGGANDEKRKQAVRLMDAWAAEGKRMISLMDGFLYLGVGKLNKYSGKDASLEGKDWNGGGVWSFPQVCSPGLEKSGALGNFYFDVGRDADGDLVLFIRLFAVKEQVKFGLGKDSFDFDRMYFTLKRDKPIKPSLLAKMKKGELFCREKFVASGGK